MADEKDPRILELETALYNFTSVVNADNLDSYLGLALSHREDLEIDLAAAKTVNDAETCRTVLRKVKTVLTSLMRLRRLKDHHIAYLEKDMKTLPKTLDEVNSYLEIAKEHQDGLTADLTAAQSMHYQDLCGILEKTEKTLQLNIGKLRRLKGKLEKSAVKQPQGIK